jgi:SAM-dependent methyltransferase
MPKTEPFDQHTDAYDQWFEKNRDRYEAELEAVRQLLPGAGAAGLEVGVGSGKFAAPLGIKIGVEPSENMAARARKMGIQVYPGVAENLPFADSSFDFVLMVTTICFVDDVGKSFQEAFRVLDSGGSIIVGFVDKDSALGRHYERKRDESKFYRHAVFFSARQVLKHLEDAGFRAVKTHQTLIAGMPVDAIRDGFGQGAFVAVKAVKVPQRARSDRETPDKL